MRAIFIGAGRGRRLMPTTADTPVISVPNTGQALGTLAAYWRGRFDIPDIPAIDTDDRSVARLALEHLAGPALV